MMRIRRSTYGVYDCLVTWLNGSEDLLPLEQSAYAHWAGIRDLTHLVDGAEGGALPQFVAMEAIQQHNQTYGTSITYEEVAGRYSHNFIFSPQAEWVIYTDQVGMNHLIFSNEDNFEEAMDHAPPDCGWMLIWHTRSHELTVFRSPLRGYRQAYSEGDDLHTEGMSPGNLLSYVLPPDLEGSITQEIGDHELAAKPNKGQRRT